MTWNDLDLGSGHPYPLPTAKQVIGSLVLEGSRTIVWPRGADAQKISGTFWATAWQGLGGQAAGSMAALRLLLAQMRELAANRDLQPVYVRWAATAQSGGYNAATSDDGYYLIESFDPVYQSFLPAGVVRCTATFTLVAYGPPAPATLSVGGLMPTAYAGSATDLIGLPPNSNALITNTRSGAEGAAYPYLLGSSLNPIGFQASATLSDLFGGGARLFDAQAPIATNPVPTSGAYTHASWVEAKGPAHNFGGDPVLTNGLLLLSFSSASGIAVWWWDTTLGAPAWHQAGQLQVFDVSGNQGTVRIVRPLKVGPEEVALDAYLITSTNQERVSFRLQRGHYEARVAPSPLSQANSSASLLRLVPSVSGNLVVYNESAATDQTAGAGSLASTANQGYGAAFLPSSSLQALFGLLYQSPPAQQPGFGTVGSGLNLGDTSGPPLNGTRYYGLFVTPFPTTANLQGDAFSGTLGTGWSSVADTGTRNGASAAQCASGTASGNADLFGTSWQPPTGTYRCAFRVRVSSAAGSAAEMTLGLWDATAGAFVAGASVTYKANQASTGYVWLDVTAGAAITAPAGHSLRFRAVTAATLGTNWLVDQAVLLPVTLAGANNGPQELWGQWAFDHTTTFPVL